MKSVFLFLLMFSQSSHAWVIKEPFSCALIHIPPSQSSFPFLITYITSFEEVPGTTLLFGSVIFEQSFGTKAKSSRAEPLSYEYSNGQHLFTGATYKLIVHASESAAECGGFESPQCRGEVEFLLYGENANRSASVLCDTHYRDGVE